MNTNLLLYAAIAAVILAAGYGYGEHQYSNGVADSEAKHAAAITKHQVELSKLRSENDEKLAAANAKYQELSNKLSGRLNKLLTENKVLRDWWNTVIPADAVNYAWVLDVASSNVPLRSGRGPDYLARNSTEAGVTNEW